MAIVHDSPRCLARAAGWESGHGGEGHVARVILACRGVSSSDRYVDVYAWAGLGPVLPIPKQSGASHCRRFISECLQCADACAPVRAGLPPRISSPSAVAVCAPCSASCACFYILYISYLRTWRLLALVSVSFLLPPPSSFLFRLPKQLLLTAEG
eukprot:scaffold22120_cov163-Isochrysis_galbana.AAC.1